MITAKDVELLRGLTKDKPRAFESKTGDTLLLYTRWFVLELPKAVFDPTFTDRSQVNEAVAAWRKNLPPGEGAYGQAVRWTNPEDSMALVKLISDVGVALIHPSMYEVITKRLPSPEFRVFEGNQPPVAIFSDGVAIGGVAQVKV